MASYEIRIPEDAYPGIMHLVALSDEEFKELTEALVITSPTFHVSEFTARVAAKVNFDATGLREIIKFVLPLYTVRPDLGVTIPQFSEIFVSALDLSPSEVEITEQDKLIVAQRLPVLLGFDTPLGVMAKTRYITAQQERLFTEARIFTELRPIFQEDPELPPMAGVILHKLKINYLENDKMQELFITLDALDLGKLRTAIDRAEKKAESLRVSLKSTSMQIMEINADD